MTVACVKIGVEHTISVTLAPVFAPPKSEKCLETGGKPTETLATQVKVTIKRTIDSGSERANHRSSCTTLRYQQVILLCGASTLTYISRTKRTVLFWFF